MGYESYCEHATRQVQKDQPQKNAESAKKLKNCRIPRSQVALGNALAVAISLPVPAKFKQPDWREMEFREEQEAFPNEIWERVSMNFVHHGA